MSATLVLSMRDPAPTRSELLSRPGRSAFWTVERDCVREFLTHPTLRFYLENDVPVVAAFESEADAERVQRWFERQKRRARHAH